VGAGVKQTGWLWWGVALLMLALAGRAFGWQGVVFGLTGIFFWLALLFSRTMRVMRRAGTAPVGSIDKSMGSAAQLQTRIQTGWSLLNVMQLTGSFGEAVGDPNAEPQVWRWGDGQDWVEVTVTQGKVSRAVLKRA
jgi:hypothetical protein